jgi:hypothetical protein
MNNIKPLILFALFGILTFAQTASGQTTARDTRFSNQLAVSPYAQAVPNDSYTFIGISHASLNSASSAIGVAVEVIGMTTTINNAAGRAQVFTVDAGETHRVFIVNQSHATINTLNSSFTDSRTHIIPTVDTPQFGSIRVTTVAADANTSVDVTQSSEDGGATFKTFENLAQLSMWGVVYVESSGSGFSMEFIGDMQDSRIVGNLGQLIAGNCGSALCASGGSAGTRGTVVLRPGAGVN